MVQFHEHIISDLLEDPTGGLVVVSSGLALHKLISSLLFLHSSSQGTLLILSATPSQRSSITHQLLLLQNPNPNIPIEITSELTAQHRHSLYTSNSIFFITSRILIVDLLNSKVPTSNIAGIIILNAHNLSDTCTESFIVRLFRSLNRSSYIRAFSDKPVSMVSGFAKAERILKCLLLRKLHLWPRFQVYVAQDLEKNAVDVVDVRVPQSPQMKGIQKAVIEAMDACLKEMRKTNKVDVEDLTVENGLFKSFDEIVRRQLDPIWHTLGKKTKQLVFDLRTLRKLLDYLVRYDAVTYLKYLDTLRVSEGVRSVWLFAESSYKVFELAKKRVYQLVRSDGGKLGGDSKSKKRKAKEHYNDQNTDNSTSAVALEEVLEEAPKWKVLREVLEEIQEERQKQASVREHIAVDVEVDNGVVLIACKDERSCMQLDACIKKGPRQVMREEWEKYLRSKVELQGFQTRDKKKSRDPKGFGVLNGTVAVNSREYGDACSINKLEHDALLTAAKEINRVDNEEIVVEKTSHRGGRGGKVNSRKAPGKVKISRTKVNNEKKTRGGKSEASNDDTNPIDVSGFCEGAEKGATVVKGVVQNHQDVSVMESPVKPLPPVQFYALESGEDILDILKPSVVIVYHPDMTFVREVEIYKAENPSKKLRVYFLFYEDSTEAQKFEASIRRENGAFESLIRQKSLMMIPVNQEEQYLGLSSSGGPDALHIQNSITRKAGGRKEAEKEMQVIVDMREFMSSLPNVLHLKGMRIIPVTLEVGDYILSPSICVERKSIMDLFQSFASGRLYHQVETMVRYYRMPVLLIEFLQDKSFSFQSASDIGDDVAPTNVISKLSLLVLHFPRLRLVWSRSLHATAEIFASLKANQDEPDEKKAMRVGVPTDDGIVEDDVRAENYNTAAVEFLRRLPGVTDSNYRALMGGCSSLADIAVLPIAKLADLMGGRKSAQMLRDFLDAKYPTMA